MILSLLTALATQVMPANLNEQDALNKLRVGMPGNCFHAVLDANTTTVPFIFTTGTTPVPVCIPWNLVVTVSASDEATFCPTLTSSVSIGSQTTRYKSYLTDTTQSYSGNGQCVTLEGGGKWSFWVGYDLMGNHVLQGTSPASTTIGGWRPGICSARQAPALPVLKGRTDNRIPFCTANGDCTEAGVSGGTCSTIDTQLEVNTALQSGCYYVMAKALNASTETSLCVER